MKKPFRPVWLATTLWAALLAANYCVRSIAPDFAPGYLIRDALSLARWSFPAAGLLWFSHAWALLLALLLGLAALGTGAPLLAWLAGDRRREKLLSIFLSVAAGFGILGTALYGLGFTGLLRPAVLSPFLVLSALAGAAVLYPVRGKGRARNRPARRPGIPGGKWLAGLALIAFLGYALSALAPETEMDSLKYHLGKPQQYALAGKIHVNANIFFKFPSLWEALLVPLMELGGEPAAKSAQPLVLLAVGGLLFAAANRSLPGTGTAAAVLLVTSYGAGRLAVTAKNDLLVGLFALAAFACWMESRRSRRRAWMAAAGLFLGFGLSVKYTAMLSVALIPLTMLAVEGKQAFRGSIPAFTWMALAYAPWGLRNWLETANPVFPFARALFGAGMLPASEFLLNQETHRYTAASYASVADRLRAAWSLAVTEHLWLIPALALPACVFSLRRRLAEFPWAFAGLAGIFLWASGPPQPRYLFQAFPFLCVALAAPALSARSGRRILAAGIFLVAGLEAVRGWTDYWSDRGARVAVAVGVIPPEEYRLEKLTTYADALAWAEAHFPPRANVLIFGPTRTFPLARRSTLRTDYEPLIPLALASESNDAAHLARKMRQAGATHMIYERLNGLAWSSQMRLLLPGDRAMKIWSEYWRGHARQVYESPVFDIREGVFMLFEFSRRPITGSTLVLPGSEAMLFDVEKLMEEGKVGQARKRFAAIGRAIGPYSFMRQAGVAIFESVTPRPQCRSTLEEVAASGWRSAWLYTTLARYAREEGDKATEEKWKALNARLAFRQGAWTP